MKKEQRLDEFEKKWQFTVAEEDAIFSLFVKTSTRLTGIKETMRLLQSEIILFSNGELQVDSWSTSCAVNNLKFTIDELIESVSSNLEYLENKRWIINEKLIKQGMEIKDNLEIVKNKIIEMSNEVSDLIIKTPFNKMYHKK